MVVNINELPIESGNRSDHSRELVELLALIAVEDQLALQQLYRKTSAHLYGVLLRLFGNNEAAEDALQETYLKIWEKSDTYKESVSQPMTWMTSIARYHALDILRSEHSARRRDNRYMFDRDDRFSKSSSSLESETADNDLLNRCLHRLDPHVREIVVDAYCGGYTHKELSNQTEKPIGTIKSWIKRALKALRDCIDELS